MDDRELWSLLNGYGPNDRDRSARHMSDEESQAYLYKKVKASTVGIALTNIDVRLILQIKEL